MLIMSLAGLSMARYFMTRMAEQPERPTYENDLPEASESPSDIAVAEADNTANAAVPAPEPVFEPEPEPEPVFEPEPEPDFEPEPEPVFEPEPEPDFASNLDYPAYATTNLNLRAGPGTAFGSIGGVSFDEGMTVIGEESGWLNVILSDGSQGWVSGNYVVAE
ncbi:MAG: SH3 domain-containing protein [Cyanobacteria bacterium P01_D01_bin.105]